MRSVITFFGADSKTGVTMLTQCIARLLSEIYKDKKVIVLHCDGHYGMEYVSSFKDNLKGIDDLKAKLVSGLLEIAELKDCCLNIGNLSILPGVSNFVDRKYYQPDLVSVLTRSALEHYDFVLIDAGSNLDIGLSVGALISADIAFLVTNQKSSVKTRYDKIESQVLSKLPGFKQFNALVINEHLKIAGLPQEKQLRQDYRIEKSFILPWSDFGWQADVDETGLEMLDEAYKNRLRTIVEHLAELTGSEMPELNSKKSLFDKFKRGLVGKET